MELLREKSRSSILGYRSYRMAGPEIIQASTPADLAKVRELFQEYAAGTGLDLCFQGFEEEVATLPGKYAPPGGRLYLLVNSGVASACGALRPFGDDLAEMKRLYVRPEFRKCGFARKLSLKLIDDARSIGYRAIYLDTLGTMVAARKLYADLGFKETGPYYANPLPDVCYLRLDL